MNNKIKAFTMIELLIVISIMLILIFLTTGVVSKVKSKSKQMQTESTFAFLKHALMMYCNATGDFPIIRDSSDLTQRKLYDSLVNISEAHPLILENYKGEAVKTITTPFMDEADLSKNHYVENERFKDAWGGVIYYYYGTNITGNNFYNPPSNENYNYKNEYYDLLSFGKNGASNSTIPETQKDDITNFK